MIKTKEFKDENASFKFIMSIDASIFHPSAFTFDRIGRFPGLVSLFESDKARKILTRAKCVLVLLNLPHFTLDSFFYTLLVWIKSLFIFLYAGMITQKLCPSGLNLGFSLTSFVASSSSCFFFFVLASFSTCFVFITFELLIVLIIFHLVIFAVQFDLSNSIWLDHPERHVPDSFRNW